MSGLGSMCSGRKAAAGSSGRSRCSAPPWRQAWLEVEPLIVVLPGLLAHLRIRRRIR